MKNGAELLDRLVKDIVTESNIFDVDLFVSLVGILIILIVFIILLFYAMLL